MSAPGTTLPPSLAPGAGAGNDVRPSAESAARAVAAGRWPALALAVLVAAALSAYRIGAKSLWLDEAYSISIAQNDWAVMWDVIVPRQANMAPYYLTLHAWLGLGTSEAAVRSLSALLAVASLIPLYGIGERLFGRGTAGLACLLLATNAFFVQYAQEARAYAFLVLTATTSTYLFIAALQRPAWRAWAAYSVVSAFAIYTHFFAALVVAAHVVSLAWVRPNGERWRGLIAAYGGVAVLVAPLLVVVLTVKHAEWVAPPSARSVTRTLTELTGHGGRLLVAVYAALCAVALVRSREARQVAGGRALGWQHALVLAWLILPPAVALVISLLGRPILMSRYLIEVLPALALLAAAGLMALRPRALRALALVALLALSARGLVRWYAHMPKENWREATSFVLARARPGDGVAFFAPYVRHPFDYYALRRPRTVAALRPIYPSTPWGGLTGRDALSPVSEREWLAERAPGSADVWLVVSHETYPADMQLEPAWLRPPPAGSFCPAMEQSFERVRVVRLTRCARPALPAR